MSTAHMTGDCWTDTCPMCEVEDREEIDVLVRVTRTIEIDVEACLTRAEARGPLDGKVMDTIVNGVADTEWEITDEARKVLDGPI